MLFAADLHLHSRYSSAVSPAMTLENIALWAQRKGVDLLGTGDCLQPQWLAEIEAHTVEAEPGLRMLTPVMERKIHAQLPAGLRRSLRFILSTEVNCVPSGTKEIEGLHQLLYFPSLAVVRQFAERLGGLGSLQDGRPTLALSARQLLRETAEFERVHQAPAHVMNPWFSALGIIGGETDVEKVYGDDLTRLLAVETGLTSDPEMLRRLPRLDGFGLYSCSDAHSLENLGRECTLLDVEQRYDAVMAALRAGTADRVRGTLKFPLKLARYYLNRCTRCQKSFDGQRCPQCGHALTMGSRDRLERLDGVRAEPLWRTGDPPSEQLRPLAYVIAHVDGKKHDTVGVRREAAEIIDQLGRHERFVLTDAPVGELLTATRPEIVNAIIAQRTGAISLHNGEGQGQLGQGAFDF